MPHSIVCRTEAKSLLEFDSWKRVPPDLKTRSQWLRAGRKVGEKEEPSARVVYPRIVEGPACFGPDTILLDQTDDFSVISESSTPLFRFTQTAPYKATSRTRAYDAFEDIFFRYARKDCWIRKTDELTGEELEEWDTVTENSYACKLHQRNRLTTGLIRKHINQRQIIGVKGGTLTRFVLIDLDYHDRNLMIFERQAEVLLDRFHGVGTWHCQVKRQDVTGIQFIYVFEEPRQLAVVLRVVREELLDLDRRHPELAAAAKAAGMRPLGELELYPTQDNGNGVRLPLCRDREMLLDRPLPLTTWRKKRVQDVEQYIDWLNDPYRKYMDKQAVLDYLHYFAFESFGPQRPRQVPQKPGGFDQGRWRGNLRRWLYEFWIEGHANRRPLNEHLAVLARLAAIYGYSEPDIVVRLGHFIRELPSCAETCSSRLLHKKYRRIDGVIRSTAKYAYRDNGHQHDPSKSTAILQEVLMRWQTFDPLDKSTWAMPMARPSVTPQWTEQQRRRLCAFFRRPLFVKDDGLILRFLSGIINLTLAKEKEGNGWGKEYLLKWMQANFPEIKCAKDEKRQRILKTLEAEGIITPLFRGRAGMYATHWTLGSVARQALGLEPETWLSEPATIAENAPLPSQTTSIVYSSLLPE